MTEIDQLHSLALTTSPVRHDHYIFWAQVAVRKIEVMKVLQPHRNLLAATHHLVQIRQLLRACVMYRTSAWFNPTARALQVDTKV